MIQILLQILSLFTIHIILNHYLDNEHIKSIGSIYTFLLLFSITMHYTLSFADKRYYNKGFVFMGLSFIRMVFSIIFIYLSIDVFTSHKAVVLHFFIPYFMIIILEIKSIIKNNHKELKT